MKSAEAEKRDKKDILESLIRELPEETRKRLNMAQEMGASNWLTTLSIRVKGFSTNKKEFTDVIAPRYGWPVDGLPHTCACGTPFDQNHAWRK